jgi:hypothetical protein
MIIELRMRATMIAGFTFLRTLHVVDEVRPLGEGAIALAAENDVLSQIHAQIGVRAVQSPE